MPCYNYHRQQGAAHRHHAGHSVQGAHSQKVENHENHHTVHSYTSGRSILPMQHIRRHNTAELMQPSRHSQQDTLHRTHDQARRRSGASHYSGLTRANLHQDCARHRNAPTENTERDSRTLLRGSVHFRRDTEPRLVHDTITPPPPRAGTRTTKGHRHHAAPSTEPSLRRHALTSRLS